MFISLLYNNTLILHFSILQCLCMTSLVDSIIIGSMSCICSICLLQSRVMSFVCSQVKERQSIILHSISNTAFH